MKTNALGKTAQRATYSLTSEKIGYVQLLWRGNIHRLDVVINKKRHNFVHSFLFLAMCKFAKIFMTVFKIC